MQFKHRALAASAVSVTHLEPQPSTRDEERADTIINVRRRMDESSRDNEDDGLMVVYRTVPLEAAQHGKAR